MKISYCNEPIVELRQSTRSKIVRVVSTELLKALQLRQEFLANRNAEMDLRHGAP